MFMTTISFFISAIIFLIASFFNISRGRSIWIYYVPFSLIFLSLWLKIIQPGWERGRGELRTTFVRQDPSAAAGYVSIISVIYGIVSAVLGHWIALFACVAIFILSLTMKFRWD